MKSYTALKNHKIESVRERCAVSPTRNTRRYQVVFLGWLLFAFSAYNLSAQVGLNNPAGVSGIFNGQVNTGCSYDPYTGNATRSVTDIAVAGAVGEYPLALVRTANSRAPSTTEVFGWAGGWNHNYNWILEDSPAGNAQNFHPTSYIVEFPDGRVEKFRAVTWDTNYRVRPGVDTPAQGTSAGVRERFVPLDTNTMFAYLILPDGGKVEFKAEQHSANGHYYYKYHVTAIYDPYGLKTTIASELVANNTRRRITKVTEPAGRYLQFAYVGTNNAKIASVTASDGRVVNYYYIYCNGCRLDHVVYFNNANWTARYQYCNSNAGQGLPPLLWTADDPMYAGPMKRIAYDYKPATPNNPDNTTPVYGQILRERYWDGVTGHETSGAVVSTLTVGVAPNQTWIRTETRGDSVTRTFVYDGGGHVTWASNFTGNQSTMGYDTTYKYVNSVTNFNRITTDYSTHWLTGNVTVATYPLTQGDTPGQSQRPTTQYAYGWAGCHDSNNQDGGNPYFLCTATDEGGQVTKFWRDSNHRVTKIDYPDGGYETFSYTGFGEVLTHRMVTGGIESFTYDARGLKQTYRNPDTASGNPTARYYYDTLDRLSDVTDVLGTSDRDPAHTTSFTYNARGQVTVTTLAKDPVDNARHTIKNFYNPDGTVYTTENEGYQRTDYTYDDYRRLTSVTPPTRGFGDSSPHTTSYYYYDPWAGRTNYVDTNAQPSFVLLPSGKSINTVYDSNWRKSSVTVGWGSGDDATTSYTYDGMGNVTWLTNPRSVSTHTIYDERNRPSSIAVAGQTTSFTYDTAGRQKSVTRPNGQVITNVSFDVMNRVTRQDASNSPGPTAVSQYTYYAPGEGPVGLLKTFKDPHLYGLNPPDQYTYEWDTMGRKKKLTYPLDSMNAHRNEQWTYDTSGRLRTFINRDGKTQTFNYDALNRLTYFTWTSNAAPRVDFGYDAVSRLTSINNANANISRAYYYDNLLRQETETILLTGGRTKAVSYTYDADGNRAATTYPDNFACTYTYTGRNQLESVAGWASYEYDENGNLTNRTIIPNGTSTDYLTYDSLDRVAWVAQHFNGTDRSFNYGYAADSNNRLWTRRTGTGQGDIGDVFRYDLDDQVIGVKLNVTTPQSTPTPTPNITYDGSGNRGWFTPYTGTSDQYTVVNNLSQYMQRKRNGTPASAVYNPNGDMTQGFDSSAYQYDAQNRLTIAPNTTFAYDGLNRQVSRTDNQGTTFNIWDGWNLIEEYQSANNGAVTAAYVYGAGGLIVGARYDAGQMNYYYQDAGGSTSHIADENGNLKEWYRYDLQGTPIIYDGAGNQLSASARNVRHLFTGQQWYKDIGLYDLRNRFYSPEIGRFLQPDPIGFRSDRTNLYRYCRNNPVTRWDPFGLLDFRIPEKGYAPAEVTYNGQSAFPGGNGIDSNYFHEINPGGTGQGDPVEVRAGPAENNYGGSPGGVSGGAPGGSLGGLGPGGFSGSNGLGMGDGGSHGLGGNTLANSSASSLLGKVLQSFNSQGGWDETATALDTFAAFEAQLLLFGEGKVAWGVGRYVLGPSVRATFSQGTIQSAVLEKSMLAFRYSSAGVDRAGSYLTTADTVAQISSPQAASIALKLPAYNTAQELNAFVIPARTRIYYGGVAGGADTATQIFVQDATVLTPFP